MRIRCAALVVFVALVAGWPLGSEAQNTAAPATQMPVYKTGARDVVVDVVVTDGKEGAISGLHAPDFEVLEDGTPQKIDFFEEHFAKTLPPGALQPLPKMPPGVYTNVPPAPESDAVNVLLLDSLNTDPQDQSYVRKNILNFLKNMPPGTRAAVFTLTSRLRMVQGFTADSAELVAAVKDPAFGTTATKPSESRTMQEKQEDADDVRRMLALTGGRMTTGIQVLMDFQQQIANVKASERVGMTLEALQYLAQYLAAVPGRKNLIWFSSNFPVAVFPHTGQSQTPNPINTADLRDYGKSIRKTADMLTLSKVAVYPIGAEGVMLEHVMDAKGPEPTDLEGGTLAGGARQAGKITPYVNENAARSDKIMAMEQLASDTGGKAFYNTNDLNGAMQRAIADGSHYYTLVYSPTNKKMDGSYRRIQIKLTEGKYKLAYRRGYNADDVTTSAANAGNNPLQPLLVRGMPSATQVLYGVRIALAATQPSPKAPLAGKNGKLTGPVRRYDVDFMIRWTDVRLDATEQGTHSGKLQVEVLAYDRDGNALNWAGATEAMDLKPDIYAAIQRSGVPAHLAIDVPADKEVFLATGVYDWTTGKAGTLEIPLRPADASTAATLTQGKPDSDRKPD